MQRSSPADRSSSGARLPTIGWREWIALPELGIPRIKVKIDTGARSSALHAYDVEHFTRRGRRMVRFKVHPEQHDTRRTVVAEAPLIDERYVKDSGGKQALRPVIETAIEFMGRRWGAEVTLTARDEMGFRMLLGRQAVRKRFLVDPGSSFHGDPTRDVAERSAQARAGGRRKSSRRAPEES